jgi:hypothetical protein
VPDKRQARPAFPWGPSAPPLGAADRTVLAHSYNLSLVSANWRQCQAALQNARSTVDPRLVAQRSLWQVIS